MDLIVPFRGSVAVALGVLTRGVLFGPRFRRLFPDVYVAATVPVDLALRSVAAAVFVAPHGVVSGYSAAELLGASCGAAAAPAEVTVPPSCRRRRTDDLVVHRERLFADEMELVGGTALTTPWRTAHDLVRWNSVTEGVVAVDALAPACRFTPGDLRQLGSRHLGARGSRKLGPVLRLADPRAESPMESRGRVALHLAGLPPEVQHEVVVGGRTIRLDLAYPSVLLGVEYDGRDHLKPDRALRDLDREALLASAGWKIIRFGAWTVLQRPHLVAARTRAELCRRGFRW